MLAQDVQLARKVGAVTMGVLALAIIFFVFIEGRIEWGRHMRVRVYFHATGGLVEGAPFVVAGREVGTIEAIALSPKGAATPLNGDEGVEVRVSIDLAEARRLVRGDVFVASRGPLSARYLELGPPETNDRVPLHEKDQLLGRDPPSLDRVIQRTWDNLQIVGGFLDEVRPQVAALRAELDQLQTTLQGIAPEVALRDEVDALVAEATRTYDALGGRPGLDHIDAVVAHTHATIAQARAMIAALRTRADTLSTGLDHLRARLGDKGSQAVASVELAIDRVRAAIDKIDPLLAQVGAIQQRIERGEGSLMKLMHDPEFPEDAKDLGKILKRQPWKIIDHP
jgi:ABC-type transporter Mla subunit MlaD